VSRGRGVKCLGQSDSHNETVEAGEEVTDEAGVLRYIGVRGGIGGGGSALYGCHRTLVRAAGGALCARELESACI